ncbi:MAG: autotransporter domain-containing protein, partial [Planctomycetia bacterium]|nr:autotransporter domain-containing protein [Planctomycetia bacterium]
DASYRLKVGSRFSWETDMTLATVKPYLLATWSHEFGKREIYVLGDSSPCPIAYRYGAHRMARDKIDLGGGVAAALRDTLDLYAQYNVELAKEYAGYYVIAGFNKKF